MNESNTNKPARELGMHGQPDPDRDQDVDDDEDEDEDEDEEEDDHNVDSTKPPGDKSLKEESEPEYTITIEFDEFLTLSRGPIQVLCRIRSRPEFPFLVFALEFRKFFHTPAGSGSV